MSYIRLDLRTEKLTEGEKAMTTELESLVGTYWFTALQTHSKVLFPQGQRNYIFMFIFKNPYFKHKLFLVLISNST